MSLPLPLPEIALFLKVRRALRVIVIGGFYACIFMAIARWLWAGNPMVHTRGYFALMTVLGLAAIAGGLLLRIARCPSCGELFAVRRAGRHRNNFTSECLNCGLRLDGANLMKGER
jgi:hypothetical protein